VKEYEMHVYAMLWQMDWKTRELTLNRPVAPLHIPGIPLLRRWFESEQLFVNDALNEERVKGGHIEEIKRIKEKIYKYVNV
jgi:hypothetical protein